MSANLSFNRSFTQKTSKWMQGLLAFIFMVSLIGMQPVKPVQAADYAWTAFNDSATPYLTSTEANITKFSYSGTLTGLLKNINTGASTGITATFSKYDTGTSYQTTTAGASPTSGTDAFSTFSSYVNTAGVINGISGPWWIDITLSGLDPTKTYTFAGTTIRNSTYTTRNTTVILSGDTSATNASTIGVTVVDSHTIAFNAGVNATGYVVRWTGINPGVDGTIVIRSRASTTAEISGSIENSYGLSVFMLAEEVSTTPTISTSVSTLTGFNSAVGFTSDEQSYTVSGTNLTHDIIITPPTDTDIEISSTSSSGFIAYPSTLTIPKGSGTVTATPIYVHLKPTSAKTYTSLNITNTSIDATQKDVAVSGSSVPLITTSSSMTVFSAAIGENSAQQSYSVSGINLTDAIVITPPGDFFISSTDGSGYAADPISFTPSIGVVSSTPIYVVFNRATAGTTSGVNITHTATDATQKDVAVSGTAIQYYTLIANVGTGGSSITLDPAGGSYASGTNVTMTAVPDTGYVFDSWSGDLSSSDNPVAITMDGDKTVTANFIPGYCVTSRVSTTNNDVEERNDTGAIDVNGDTTTKSLQMFRTYGTDTTGTLNWWGLRFLNVNVPQGAIIASANVTFRANVTSDATASGLTLWGQLATAPSTFTTTAYDVTNRTRTTATTEWTVPQWTSGSNYQTPDLATIVQEIVNQSGWVDNNAMVIVGQTTVSQNRSAISYDSTGGSTLAPLLQVCYTVGPTITTSVSTLTAFSTPTGTPSAEQFYTVSGTNLTGDVTITPPTYFELSQSSGADFSSDPIVLSPSDGSITDTFIYVRLNPTGTSPYSGEISHTGGGADSKNVTVSGTTGDPIISIINTMSAFEQALGAPSEEQTYTLSATYLKGDLIVTPPPDFEISKTTGTGWASPLTFTPVSGIIPTTTVYVRMNRSTEGFSSGDITHASTDATTRNASVSGTAAVAPIMVTFQQGVSSYDGTIDTTIKYNTPTTSYGNQAYFEWDTQEGTGDTPETGLLQFNNIFGSGVGQIPLGSTITSATLRYRIYSQSGSMGDSASVYESLVSWDEATTYDTFGSEAGVQADEYNPTLVDTALATTASTNYTIDVTASLQNWAMGASNYGWIFRPDDSDGAEVHSSETTTVDYRPLLTVNYLLSTEPIILITGSLTPFSTSPTVPSTEQIYTVSGSNLTDDINISAPTGFEIKTESGTYGPSLALTPDGGGLVASSAIYVRMNSATEGSFGGDITHTSTDATTQNLAVTGEVAIAPMTIIFQDGLEVDSVTYDGTRDTYIHNTDPGDVRGGEATFIQDYDSETIERRSLLRFDLSAIPEGSTIESAVFDFYVTAAGLGFNMFPMLVSWDEATVTYTSIGGRHFQADDIDAQSAIDANWTGGSVGFSSVSISASTIQDWVDGTLTNNGWLMIATDIPDGDGQQLASRENGTQARNPKLTVNYYPPSSDPTITVSSALTPFTTSMGVPSTAQTYTVSGRNLTEDISITALTGFEIKTESGTYGPSLALTPDGEGEVASTIIEVHLNSASAGSFGGNITHISSPATTRNVAVSGTVSNLSPYMPTLVSPLDDATGVVTPPTLEVTVSDPESESLDVSFYGREAGGTAEDFTIIVMPDTQRYADTAYPARYDTFYAMTDWIADNISAENIVFVTHVGDIVENNYTDGWVVADAAYDTLDIAGVPYSVSIGNNDFDGDPTYTKFEANFGISRFTGKSWYGGHYGSNNVNSYSLFSASGMDFIVINVNYNPSAAELDWADALLKANPTRSAIVVSHNQLSLTDGWSNQEVFTALQDNPNLFLMLSGHLSSAADGSAKRTDIGSPGGQNIYSTLQDYQSWSDPNNGYLRIYRFSPTDDKIYMTTYSPTLDAYETTDADGTLTLDYTMPDGASFELIETDTEVTSGSNASISWTGLAEDTEYEWYVEVTDGTTTTTGPTWSFTTEAAAVNVAPVLDPIGSQLVDELAILSFGATATDDGLPSGTLTYTLAAGSGGVVPAGASITTGGDFTWTPSEEQGDADYTFDVCVSDGDLSDCETIIVTVSEVNVAPVITEGESVSVIMSEDGVPTAFGLTLNATDVDLPADLLTWSISTAASNGTASASGTGLSKVVGYTPTTDYNGSDSFVVQVSDGSLSDTILVNVTVESVNDAPVNSVPDTQSMLEDTTLIFNSSRLISVSDLDVSETANGKLQVSISVSHGTLTLSQTTDLTFDSGDGVGDASMTFRGVPSLVNAALNNLSYQPVANYNGSDTLQIITSDLGNTGSGGVQTDTDGVLINITEANDAPILGTIGPQLVDELATLSFSATATDDGLPSGTLSYTLAAGSAGAVPAGASITTDGDFSWMPSEEQGGEDYTFDVCVSDGLLSDCETITVTVSEVNVAPVLAAIGDKSIAELVELSFTATATDVDDPADTLSFSLDDGTSGAVPTGASITSGGDFSWTPTEAQGPDDYAFDVCVSDGLLPDCETITVTVSEVNVAPVLGEIGNKSIAELVELSFTATASDVDDPANTLTFSLANGTSGAVPAGAGITTDGDFSWTPSEEQGDADYIFDVCVSDGLLPDCETITVSVGEVNVDPVITEGETVSVIMSENGTPTAFSLTLHATDTDLPVNLLTWSLFSGASNGTAIVSGTGVSPVISYTPTTNYIGLDSFVVQVDDGDGGFDTITVDVTISEVLYTISGNAGVAGATISYLIDSIPYDVISGLDGSFTFQVPSNWTGTITPSLAVYTFDPVNASYSNVLDDVIVPTFTATPITHSIDLVVGWNLVSFNLHPISTDIENILTDIAGHYGLVYAWDANGDHSGSGNWMKYDPAASFGNTLTTLDEKTAFWIYVTTADTLDVIGEYPTTSDIDLLDNAGGWNLVGFPSASGLALPAALEDHGVETSYTMVYAYHAADSSDPWKIFDPTAASWVNDLKQLDPGWGYWIFVTADVSWQVAY